MAYMRFPIESAFRMVPGCVVHIEKGGSCVEFPHSGREWLITRGDLMATTNRKPDVACTVDGEPEPAADRDEGQVPVRSRGALDQSSGRSLVGASQAKLPTGDTVESSETLMKSRRFM